VVQLAKALETNTKLVLLDVSRTMINTLPNGVKLLPLIFIALVSNSFQETI
jgi:hypothetical protein